MGAPLQASPTPIPVEQRFPLDLDASDHVIRALYEEAKSSRWDPFRAFDWPVLDAAVVDPKVREAARLAYSRRAWQVYTGLTETPATLIRFCLEAGREADPKYFLTVRNTEEAWHIESFHGVARTLGGDVPAPRAGAFADVFNQRRATTVLDAGSALDAWVVTYCAIEEELELRLAEASRANAKVPLIANLWDHVVADRKRHAAFGWAYVSRRAAGWSAADRTAIVAAATAYVTGPLFAGYQCVSLAAPGVADEFVAAEETLATAGLGGVRAADEQAVLRATLADVRKRLDAVGIALPAFRHPRLDTF